MIGSSNLVLAGINGWCWLVYMVGAGLNMVWYHFVHGWNSSIGVRFFCRLTKQQIALTEFIPLFQDESGNWCSFLREINVKNMYLNHNITRFDSIWGFWNSSPSQGVVKKSGSIQKMWWHPSGSVSKYIFKLIATYVLNCANATNNLIQWRIEERCLALVRRQNIHWANETRSSCM